MEGDELRDRIQRILRADTTMRALLDKVTEPYGVYYGRPPEKPVFPNLTYSITMSSVGGGGYSEQVRTYVLRLTAYSKTNCDAIMERAEQLFNHSTYFNSMDMYYVLSCQLESVGQDEFEHGFKCYSLTHNYKIYAVVRPTVYEFAQYDITTATGATLPAAGSTELKTKLRSILTADSTLKTMLSKASAPYGVYWVRPPQATPPFPLITAKFIGGFTDQAGRDSQTRSMVLQISAYSKTNPDLIMRRIDDLLIQNQKFTSMTYWHVWNMDLESILDDDFDPEFQCYVRTHRYRLNATKRLT